jgi:HPt (histidine-containing phosphotransfer) domain-containing protein
MSTTHVLDDDALHRLGEQLGDPDVLCGFLRRYLSLLDARIARLEQALAAADQADWMDAVLSLKTSSAMAGARALAEQAAELEQQSAACPSWRAPVERAGTGSGLTRRAERIACLRRLAAETARQLRLFLQQLSGTCSR